MNPTRYLRFIPTAARTGLILTLSAVTDCTSKPTVPSGPPAMWQTQLAVAQQAARGQDANALLMQVDAFPVPQTQCTASGDYGTLQADFRFARSQPMSNGAAEQISVTLYDAAPKDSAEVEGTSTYNWRLADAAQRQQILQNIANVQISAADAYTRTIGLARTQAARYRGNVYPMMSLLLDSQQAQISGAPGGVAAVWLIHYTPSDGQCLPLQGATTLRIYVDPHSGAILDQHEGPP